MPVAELGVVRRSAIVIAGTKPIKTPKMSIHSLPSYPMPRLSPVCFAWRASPPSHASRATSAAMSAPLPRGSTTTPASATFSPRSSRMVPRASTGRRFWALVRAMRSVVASFPSPVTRSSSARARVARLLFHLSTASERTPNHALQRTAALAVSFTAAVVDLPGSVTASANAHAVPSPRAAVLPSAASKLRSLSLRSLGDN